MELEFNYNDGGRSNYFKGQAGDCVVRAISIALGKDYKEVYRESAKILGYTPRDGVRNNDTKKLVKHYGGQWVATMSIGTGCKCHLAKDEVPMDSKIICNVSGHLTTVLYGVINDVYNPSRGGTRCVYGYWIFK